MLRKLTPQEVRTKLTSSVKKTSNEEKKTSINDIESTKEQITLSVATGGELKVTCTNSKYAMYLLQKILETNSDEKHAEEGAQLQGFLESDDRESKSFYIANRAPQSSGSGGAILATPVDSRLMAKRLSEYGSYLTSKSKVGLKFKSNAQKEQVLTLLGFSEDSPPQEVNIDSTSFIVPGIQKDSSTKRIHNISLGDLSPAVTQASAPAQLKKKFTVEEFKKILVALYGSCSESVLVSEEKPEVGRALQHWGAPNLYAGEGYFSISRNLYKSHYKWVSEAPLVCHIYLNHKNKEAPSGKIWKLTFDPATLEVMAEEGPRLENSSGDVIGPLDYITAITQTTKYAGEKVDLFTPSQDTSTVPIELETLTDQTLKNLFPMLESPDAKTIQQALKTAAEKLPSPDLVDEKKNPTQKVPVPHTPVTYQVPDLQKIMNAFTKMIAQEGPLLSDDCRMGVANGVGIKSVRPLCPGLTEQFALTWVTEDKDGEEAPPKLLMSYYGVFDYAGSEEPTVYCGSCLLSFDTEKNQITTQILPVEGETSATFTSDKVINFWTEWAKKMDDLKPVSKNEKERTPAQKTLIKRLQTEPEPGAIEEENYKVLSVVKNQAAALASCKLTVLTTAQVQTVMGLIQELKKSLENSFYDKADLNYMKRTSAIDEIIKIVSQDDRKDYKTEDDKINDIIAARLTIKENLNIVLNNKPSWKERHTAFLLLGILSGICTAGIVPILYLGGRHLFYTEPATKLTKEIAKAGIPVELISAPPKKK